MRFTPPVNRGQVHDAVFASGIAFAAGKKTEAVALWEMDRGRADNRTDQRRDSIENATDAVILMLERTWMPR
jgi:hypothetical protein